MVALVSDREVNESVSIEISSHDGYSSAADGIGDRRWEIPAASPQKDRNSAGVAVCEVCHHQIHVAIVVEIACCQRVRNAAGGEGNGLGRERSIAIVQQNRN